MCSTSRCRWFSTAGFPIRTSPDCRLFTATRGFSQCPTSFFGTWRLGIHRKPLVASLRNAEKSKFFDYFFHYFFLTSSSLRLIYSVGKVLGGSPAQPCASSYFTCLQVHQTHASAIYPAPSDNTARQIAGPSFPSDLPAPPIHFTCFLLPISSFAFAPVQLVHLSN